MVNRTSETNNEPSTRFYYCHVIGCPGEHSGKTDVCASSSNEEVLDRAIAYYERHKVAPGMTFINLPTLFDTLGLLKEFKALRSAPETAERIDWETMRRQELNYIEEVLINIRKQGGEFARESANDTLAWLRNRLTVKADETSESPRAEQLLLGIVRNWNEFGPDGGIDELMHYATRWLDRRSEKANAICPHGFVLADNTCGPCSEGRPNRPAQKAKAHKCMCTPVWEPDAIGVAVNPSCPLHGELTTRNYVEKTNDISQAGKDGMEDIREHGQALIGAMLPNDHHPGPRCSCRYCLKAYVDGAPDCRCAEDRSDPRDSNSMCQPMDGGRSTYSARKR